LETAQCVREVDEASGVNVDGRTEVLPRWFFARVIIVIIIGIIIGIDGG